MNLNFFLSIFSLNNWGLIVLIMKRKERYILEQKKTTSRLIAWGFFAIIAFLGLYPFLSNTLRYQTGAGFSQLLTMISGWLNTIGTIFLMIGAMTLFCNKNIKGLVFMITGAILLSFSGGPFGLFSAATSSGYH